MQALKQNSIANGIHLKDAIFKEEWEKIYEAVCEKDAT